MTTWLLVGQILLLGLIVPGVKWLYSIRTNDLAHINTALGDITTRLGDIDQRLAHIEGRLEGM